MNNNGYRPLSDELTSAATLQPGDSFLTQDGGLFHVLYRDGDGPLPVGVCIRPSKLYGRELYRIGGEGIRVEVDALPEIQFSMFGPYTFSENGNGKVPDWIEDQGEPYFKERARDDSDPSLGWQRKFDHISCKF